MKKYFLKKNKQEVKLGDEIKMETPVDTSYGKGVATVIVTVTEAILKKLISDGFVYEVDSAKTTKTENPFKKIFHPLGSRVVVLGVKEDFMDAIDSIFEMMIEDERQREQED